MHVQRDPFQKYNKDRNKDKVKSGSIADMWKCKIAKIIDVRIIDKVKLVFWNILGNKIPRNNTSSKNGAKNIAIII